MPGTGNAQDDPSRRGQHRRAHGLSQQQGCQGQAEEGHQQLQLPDSGDPALGQAAIPEDEADQHREHRDIARAQPDRQGNTAKPVRCRDNAEDQHGRQGKDQRPRDDLPTAQMARQASALRIGHPAQQDAGDQHRIANRIGGSALPQGKTDDQRGTEQRESPEGGMGALTGAQYAEQGGDQRQ